MKLTLLILISAMLCSCASYEKITVSNTTTGLTTDANGVYEAVLRHQFDKNASGQQQTVKTYFVEIEGADPASDFLARFSDIGPHVKPASEGFYRSDSAVFDKATKSTALLFRLKKIIWLNSNTAEVEGGYYEGNLSSSGNSYRVKRSNGKWIVESDTLKWIS